MCIPLLFFARTGIYSVLFRSPPMRRELTARPDHDLLNQLTKSVRPAREGILSHSLYDQLSDVDDVRRFMEFHVYAVWDFMTYLKALQRKVTCVKLPWRPAGNGLTRRLINDIVLEEESDETPDGAFTSHFEMYREAMKRVDADTTGIDGLLNRLDRGVPFDEALDHPDVPNVARSFIGTTRDVVQTEQPHRIAAAFTLGREDLIPDLFHTLIEELYEEKEDRLELYFYYLQRHMELDEEEHGPMSLRMLVQLCGDDKDRWNEAEEAARNELMSRRTLWDAAAEALSSGRSSA